MAGPWQGVRVLELDGPASAYATRLWAALGADVVVAEPAPGHPYRAMAPFAPGHGAPEGSLWWAFLGQGKRSVVVDDAGTGALVRAADVVVGAPPAVDAADPEGQVVVSVTPFGRTGPRAHWKGSDLVAWSSATLPYVTGFPDRAPVAPAPLSQLAYHVTAMHAVVAAMLALRVRRRTGRGQLLDISMQECCLALAPESGLPVFLDDRVHRGRPGNRRAVTRPFGLYPCADGHVSLIALQPAHWKATAAWIAEVTGVDAILDPSFADMAVRWEAAEFVDELVEATLAGSTKLELFVDGQRRGVPLTPVNTVADLRNDPHMAAAGFWRAHDHPVLGSLTVPGEPFRTTHDWWAWRRAPLLGEHTDEVMGQWQPT